MCLPRGTVPAPSHLCRSGVLASPAPAPSQTLKDPRLTGAPPLWYLLRALRRGRAPQDSTEESVSDACGLLRPCRRSGTPQGIPAAEGRLQGSGFFRAWRAFREQDNGGGNAAGHTRKRCTGCTRFWISMLSCTSPFYQKKTLKKFRRLNFLPCRNACRASLPAIDNCL